MIQILIVFLLSVSSSASVDGVRADVDVSRVLGARQPYRGIVIARYDSDISDGGALFGYDGSTGAYFQISDGKIFGVDASGEDFKGDSYRAEIAPIEGDRVLFADALVFIFPMLFTETVRRFPDRVTRFETLDGGGSRIVIENLIRGQIKFLDPARAATWPLAHDEGELGVATIDLNSTGVPVALTAESGPNSGTVESWSFDYGPDPHPDFPVATKWGPMTLVGVEHSTSDPARFTMDAVLDLAMNIDTRYNQSPPMILVSKNAPVQLSPDSDVIPVPEEHRQQSERALNQTLQSPQRRLPLLSRWPLILTGITLIAAGVWYRVRHAS